MPEIVKTLTATEKLIEEKVHEHFSEEQICVFFLTKSLRSIYQFKDEFIADWHHQIFKKDSDSPDNNRIELVLEYTKMLMLEKKYDNHMKYWTRQLQDGLLDEMILFFSGEPGK